MSAWRASLRLRRTAASNLAISARVVLCGFSFPICAKFSKVMFLSQNEKLRLFQHTRHEGAFFLRFVLELGQAVNVRVDLPAKLFLAGMQRTHNLFKRRAPNHHDINVAGTTLGAACDRAVYESHRNLVTQCCQPCSQYVSHPRSLLQDSPQLVI